MIQDRWLVVGGARGHWVHLVWSFLCSSPGTAKAEREAWACWRSGPGAGLCWFDCLGDETAHLRRQLPRHPLTQRVGLLRIRNARSPRPWFTCVLLLPSLIFFQFQLFFLWTLDAVLAAGGTNGWFQLPEQPQPTVTWGNKGCHCALPR